MEKTKTPFVWVAGLALSLVLAAPVAAQSTSAADIWRSVTGRGGPVSSPTLTQREAEAGLKEALTLAAQASAQRLGGADGFWGDLKVRIPLPARLAQAQRTLKPMGLAGPLDDVEMRINRAAEAAMPEAGELIVAAVRSLSMNDALAILRGGDDAATRFLRGRTEQRLSERLRPLMTTALTEAGALAAADSAARRAGLLRYSSTLKQDMSNFATIKALDGLFYYLAAEERAIRADPAKHVTAVLARVFGAGR